MRKLRKEEIKLINLLLNKSDYDGNYDLDNINVIDMEDGKMGSITFLREDENIERFMKKTISEMTFKDEDGTPIIVSLNIDLEENLYELDIWKVDFTEVKKYPSIKTIE